MVRPVSGGCYVVLVYIYVLIVVFLFLWLNVCHLWSPSSSSSSSSIIITLLQMPMRMQTQLKFKQINDNLTDNHQTIIETETDDKAVTQFGWIAEDGNLVLMAPPAQMTYTNTNNAKALLPSKYKLFDARFEPIHRVLLEDIYAPFSRILLLFGIEHFFAITGTLIGAMREQPPGFVPWDHDMDFGILFSAETLQIILHNASFQASVRAQNLSCVSAFKDGGFQVSKLDESYEYDSDYDGHNGDRDQFEPYMHAYGASNDQHNGNGNEDDNNSENTDVETETEVKKSKRSRLRRMSVVDEWDNAHGDDADADAAAPVALSPASYYDHIDFWWYQRSPTHYADWDWLEYIEGTYAWQYWQRQKIIGKELFPLRRVPFETAYHVFVPNDSIAVLDKIYGKYKWRCPHGYPHHWEQQYSAQLRKYYSQCNL